MKDFIATWQTYVHAEPTILAGKPVVRGTCLSVDFLLELVANGWREETMLQEYPQLTSEARQAIFQFVAEYMRDAAFYTRIAA